MIVLTAIIKARKGEEETMKTALLEIADYAATQEPGTISYYCGQDSEDPTVFTTYERFRDRAALDAHNGSDAAAAFFALAKPLFAEDPIIQVTEEIFAH
ncbi:MAG: hypothetical protein Kilf2KO_30340 [Rhodospirillales bacterium]